MTGQVQGGVTHEAVITPTVPHGWVRRVMPGWQPRQVGGLARRERRTAVAFAAPAAIATVGIILVPLVYAVWLSLHRTPLVGPPVFSGLQEYRQVLHTGAFWQSLVVTAEVAIPTIVVELVVGTALALVLHGLRAAGVFRLLLILPILLSPAIVGADWTVMLDRTTGIVNYLLSAVGLPEVAFTATRSFALPTVDAIYAWQNVGFTLLVITAGLASINGELIDAITVDGANYMQRLRHLVLPLLRPLIAIIVFWRFVALVEDYGLVALLTNGGPGTRTTTATLYLYNQLSAGSNTGFASAAAILLAIMTIIVGMALARFARVTGKVREA